MVQMHMLTGMMRAVFFVFRNEGRMSRPTRIFTQARGFLLALAVAFLAGPLGAGTEEGRSAKSVSYYNDKVPDGAWSVHVVRIDRTNSDYELHSMLAAGSVQGMTTLSEQVR